MGLRGSRQKAVINETPETDKKVKRRKSKKGASDGETSIADSTNKEGTEVINPADAAAGDVKTEDGPKTEDTKNAEGVTTAEQPKEKPSSAPTPVAEVKAEVTAVPLEPKKEEQVTTGAAPPPPAVPPVKELKAPAPEPVTEVKAEVAAVPEEPKKEEQVTTEAAPPPSSAVPPVEEPKAPAAEPVTEVKAEVAAVPKEELVTTEASPPPPPPVVPPVEEPKAAAPEPEVKAEVAAVPVEAKKEEQVTTDATPPPPPPVVPPVEEPKAPAPEPVAEVKPEVTAVPVEAKKEEQVTTEATPLPPPPAVPPVDEAKALAPEPAPKAEEPKAPEPTPVEAPKSAAEPCPVDVIPTTVNGIDAAPLTNGEVTQDQITASAPTESAKIPTNQGGDVPVTKDAPAQVVQTGIDAGPMTNGEVTQDQKQGLESIPYTFTWESGGKQVALAGSFNKWTDPVPLIEKAGVFSLNLKLSEGEHHYKYEVDGNWVTNNTQPVTELDGHGQVNVAVVKPGTEE